MKDLTGELRPHAGTLCRSLIRFVGILQAPIYITIWCATMHDNKRAESGFVKRGAQVATATISTYE